MTGIFCGSTIIVTAAAQGIGAAIACAFAKSGAQVLALDIADKPLAKMQEKYSGITAVCMDATDHAAIANWAQSLDAVNGLVNCVGMVAEGSALDCEIDAWQASLQVNISSTFYMCRSIIPLLQRQQKSFITNISSVVSEIKPVKNRFAYGTTKAAVNGLTRSIAVDFLADGVRCNAIAPGTVRTPSWQERVDTADDPKQAEADFIARQPMGRLGSPEEIAALALYLGSEQAGYVTGQIFTIDGGMSL